MQTWQLFIRHAHRDTSEREQDNGLSAKGRVQGTALVAYLDSNETEYRPTRVISSPKKRCVQTAEFVAKWAGVTVEIDPRLDEQARGEKDKDFVARVRALFDVARSQSGTCWVSHGDLLPMMLEFAGYWSAEVNKGDLFLLIDGKVQTLNPLSAR